MWPCCFLCEAGILPPRRCVFVDCWIRGGNFPPRDLWIRGGNFPPRYFRIRMLLGFSWLPRNARSIAFALSGLCGGLDH